MPRLNPDFQRVYWKLADALAKALRSPQSGQPSDNKWRVTALASKAWKISHPELPIVETDDGQVKDPLLQLHITQEPNTGDWLLVAQNKVVGPDSHSSPRALILAREKEPPNDSWDIEGLAFSAADFFRHQKKELVERAKAMAPTTPPGESQQMPNPGPGSVGPLASRKKRLARLIVSYPVNPAPYQPNPSLFQGNRRQSDIQALVRHYQSRNIHVNPQTGQLSQGGMWVDPKQADRFFPWPNLQAFLDDPAPPEQKLQRLHQASFGQGAQAWSQGWGR